MNNALIFIGKEVKEQIRTYKTLIIITILTLFGISSPIMAKIMPELISNMDVGFEIVIPTPTYLDAFAQFYNNVTQMGIMVVILVFSGVVSAEKSKGTMIIMLTKNISRTRFLLSKLLSMIGLFTVAYFISAGACLLYTVYLFPDTKLDGVFIAFFCLWLFIVLIIVITLLTSSLSNNHYIGTIGAFLGWFTLIMTGYIPKVKEVTPLALGSWNMQIISGIKTFSDLRLPILTGSILIVILFVLTCVLFKKQEI